MADDLLLSIFDDDLGVEDDDEPAQGDFPDASYSWTDLLPRSGDKPRACLRTVEIAVQTAPELAGRIRFDEFSCQVTVTAPLPWRERSGAWTNSDPLLFASWLQQHDVYVSPSTVTHGVLAAAMKNSFHPVRDYLSGLKWDGRARLNEIGSYWGCHDPSTHDALRRWFISAVARVFQPGCRADLVPVFEGRQGVGKSRSLEVLFAPWFCDHLPDLYNKDAFLQLQGRWCVEVAEFDTFTSATAEKVKAFISSPVDRFRPPYGTVAEDRPRQCVLAATTNSDSWHSDSTGGRRWIPVACSRVDVDALAQARDQIWAEAYHLYSSGSTWWADGCLLGRLAEQVEARYTADPWEALISAWLDGRNETKTEEVLMLCIGRSRAAITRQDQMRVGEILRRLGWVRTRRRCGGDLKEVVYVRSSLA
ncbi:MAG: hypothetical protein KatS3mg005_2059 [Bryobacteraceae bacterium]|nr:MAG: hypothetical protein KatS3mg005_2059 [Bryobacteraceae bacterium]